jgi:hypothetical protein
VLLAAALSVMSGLAPCATELVPHDRSAPLGPQGPQLGTFAARTLVVALELDRDTARVVAYTLKARPFVRPLDGEPPRPRATGDALQVEVVLLGRDGGRYTSRLDVGPLCLDHGAETAPHVTGDTVRAHRETFLVELPEVAGFDRVEIAVYDAEPAGPARRVLGAEALDERRFTPAGGPWRHADLRLGAAAGGGAPRPLAADVLWPESFGDPALFQVYGDLAEGDRRINVVIVPDGYRYAEKALMEAHAAQLVAHFRSRTPYAEHDPFLNYFLVYAYSVQSGTDQCDCDIEVNTAMGTRFLESNPQCGHSDNRCLYYGPGCDTDGEGHIVEAELRAPYHDKTIVMVNTTRYGGCGGLRAVYSASYAAPDKDAKDIALHELGHALGGLADEYWVYPGCGGGAGGVNTSTDPVTGAWPEWIDVLGPPRPGGEYYAQCVYRPQDNCLMRSLGQPFCAVCNQQGSLVTFGHPRVAPTAPIESMAPAPDVEAYVSVPVEFSVATRLSTGPAVTNDLRWTIDGPGYPGPTVVAQGLANHLHTFDQPGTYTLTAEVVADTNFVQPSKYGANADTVSWSVEVVVLPSPPEVSPPGAAEPLRFVERDALIWEDASAGGVWLYNLYRGGLDGLPAGDGGACLLPALETNAAAAEEAPPAGTVWTYLVSGVNPLGEGPLGQGSSGQPRTPGAPCR